MPFLRQAAATAATLLSVFALTGVSPAKANTSESFRLWDNYIPTGPSDPNGALCATPSGGNTANGTIVTGWYCNGDASQWWHYEETSYGNFLVNDKSHRCLTPSGGGTAAGTVLTLWTCDPNKAEISQKWGQAGNGAMLNLHSDREMATKEYSNGSPGEPIVLDGRGLVYWPTQ
jgi:Ricin-type beta-trefoil lectin domain